MSFSVCFILVFAATLTRCGVSGVCSSKASDRQSGNIVQTTHGRVQGRTETIRVKDRDVEVNAFLGIPFAKPPVGDLRFQRPVPIGSWDDVLQARTPPNSCMQVLMNNPEVVPNPSTPVSEDCLYLNIWTPRSTDRKTSYKQDHHNDYYSNMSGTGVEGRMSTMVWIHGGLYIMGSSTVSLYNGAQLAASEGVIVVTINYRLGALGFMSFGVPENPGNMGLLDMSMALQWLSDNVDNFGGFKDSLTLFSHSIGGSSAALLLMSPITKHLIKNVIFQSASLAVRLTQQSQESALEAANAFSDLFNCTSDNKSITIECLKQVDAVSLTLGHLQIVQNLDNFMTAVVDGYFLTQSYLDALDNGAFKRCNIIIGTTQDDGTAVLNLLYPDFYNFRQQQAPRPLTDQELDQRLTQILNNFFEQEKVPQILADVKDLYHLDQLKQEVPNASFTLLNYLTTDIVFSCPSRLLASFYANNSQDVYMYSFNHFPDITPLPTWIGVTHELEIPLVFGNTVPDIPTFSPREVILNQEIMNYWANFAKFGYPSTHYYGNTKWPTYSPPDPGNILLFTESTDIQVGRTETSRCAYWNSLPRDYNRD